MRTLFWLFLLLTAGALTFDQINKKTITVESNSSQVAQILPQPGQREIYFIEASPSKLADDAKLSSVPMVVLYYRPNDKRCQQQESLLQDVSRGWLNHLRFYKINVTKWAGTSSLDVPTVLFLQPDSTGYPVVLNHTSSFMDRTQTYDFISTAMKLVKTTSFTANRIKLAEISGSEIGNVVKGSNCPAVVLFLEDNSFAGMISEQVLLEGAKKYNQQAMFFRCTETALDGLIPGVWPSTYSFVLQVNNYTIKVEQVYGQLSKSKMEALLKKLPPASPNKPY